MTCRAWGGTKVREQEHFDARVSTGAPGILVGRVVAKVLSLQRLRHWDRTNMRSTAERCMAECTSASALAASVTRFCNGRCRPRWLVIEQSAASKSEAKAVR